jgi:valyl-tRNA synthetase
MIMAGYEFQGKAPFTNVYLTGLVRDTKGRKMSKSLGNSPDALDLISRFGADGVRVGLMLSAPAGNDLLFDEALCEQGRNFANKVWNAFRLFHGWEVKDGSPTEAAEAGLVWYQSRLNQVIEQIEDHFARYRVSDALMAIYKLIWDDFCSWLLEVVKPVYGEPIDRETYDRIAGLFEQNLILLHPFMPFLTEEAWQNLRERKTGETLCLQQWPEAQSYDQSVLGAFEKSKEIIAGIRTIRKEKQISPKESLELWYMDEFREHPDGAQSVIIKLANISRIEKCETSPEGAASFRVGNMEYFVPISGSVDLKAEREKIQKELDYTRGFLASVEKKLSNERFVSNAPEQVVELERKKASDAETRIETLLRSLENLN